jgi:TubC N-terminal docking domain
MAEHAFERFRRLRDVAQPVARDQAQQVEGEVLVSLLALLHQLQNLSVRLTPYPNGTLRCRAKKGVITAAVAEAIRQNKAELHALVEDLHEREALQEEGQALRIALPLVTGACRHADVAMAGNVLMCCHCRQALF